MPSLEVLAVLADEVGEIVDGMSAALGDLTDTTEPERRREALGSYNEQAQRIGAAAEMLGLAGLQQVCEWVMANVAELQTEGAPPERLAAFMRWPNLLP